MVLSQDLCVFLLFLSVNLVSSQYNTPCPGIFDYDSDGVNIYGKIVLNPSGPVSSLILRINYTITTQLLSNYVGRIEAEDSNGVLQRYNQGVPVNYRVHFPVTSPVPKITAITVNGDTICYGPGDVPGPNQYVTTSSLQHTSFLQGGSQPMFGGTFQRPQDQEQVFQVYNDDTQVYTINNIENMPWYSDIAPFVVNKPKPQRPQKPVSVSSFNSQSRPIYDNTKYDQEDQGFDFDIRDGSSFEPTTKRPATMRPRPQASFYPQSNTQAPFYPKQTTQAPIPVVPQQPVQRQPERPAQSNSDCGVVAGGNENVPLILNGKSYARGDVPWLTAIYKTDGGSLSFICGGTLVSDRHVITAAHCMQRRSELTSIKDFVIKVGVHNLNDWSDDITVTRTVISAAIHESFNATTLENDILIFTINKRVEFNTYVRRACLWNGNTELNRIVGASGVVAGWGEQGTTSSGKRGDPALVRVPIVSTAVCRASKPHFHWLTSDTTLCAGDRNGAGPCKGDSGGGLYVLDNGKWRLRGVVSISLRPENGDNTCNLDEYIVFTDTAQYLPWIRDVISENYFD